MAEHCIQSFFPLFNALVPTTVHIGAQKTRDAQGDGFLCAFFFSYIWIEHGWKQGGGSSQKQNDLTSFLEQRLSLKQTNRQHSLLYPALLVVIFSLSSETYFVLDYILLLLFFSTTSSSVIIYYLLPFLLIQRQHNVS